jgi:hypothetical protein
MLASNQATLSTLATHNFAVGDSVTVALPTSGTVVGKARSGSTVVITTSSAHGFSIGDIVTVALPTTATLTGNVVGDNNQLITVTTTTAHGFSVGDKVTFSGFSITRLNGTKTIESVPTGTTFTFRDWDSTSATFAATTSVTMVNTTNQSYNGTKTLISASGTTFAYNF